MTSQAILSIAFLIFVAEMAAAALSMGEISKKTTLTHYMIDKGTVKPNTLKFDPGTSTTLICPNVECNSHSTKPDFVILAFGFKVGDVLAKGREWADAYMNAQGGSRSGNPVELIVLDWDKLSMDINDIKTWGNISTSGEATLVKSGYPEVAHKAVDIGGYVKAMIKSLIDDKKVDPAKIQLIGEGLAAHMMAVASRGNAPKIGRLTGLDPAGPFFEEASGDSGFSGKYTPDTVLQNSRLKKTDAIFVDVIHTNGGMMLVRADKKTASDLDLPDNDKFGDIRPCSDANNAEPNCAKFGDLKALGHVDFYVGDGKDYIGRIQPECDQDGNLAKSVCSHTYARTYYLETIAEKDKYGGYKCKDLAHCLVGTAEDPKVYMGNEIRKDADKQTDAWNTLTGVFYVKVTAAVKGWVIAVAVIVTLIVLVVIIGAVICVRKKRAGGGGRDMSDMGGAASYQNHENTNR